MNTRFSRFVVGVILGTVVVIAAGCGKSKEGYGRYVPSEETARNSLRAALDAWKQGGKPGQITTVSPTVQVVDSVWQEGGKLGSYEIVGGEEGDGPRWFSVRLKLVGSNAEQVVRYVVVGREPIWVYREADYKKATGM